MSTHFGPHERLGEVSDLGPPLRIHLVRHGTTEQTSQGLLVGAGSAPGPGLSSTGREQVARLRDCLLPRSMDVQVTSDLARARESIALLSDRSPDIDPRWAEAHFGSWEGLAVAEVRRLWPGRWENTLLNPGAAPPNGESWNDVSDRVQEAWLELVGKVEPGQSALVCTHLTPIRAVLAKLLKLGYPEVTAVEPRPGTQTVIEVWQDGGFRLVALGSVDASSR